VAHTGKEGGRTLLQGAKEMENETKPALSGTREHPWTGSTTQSFTPTSTAPRPGSTSRKTMVPQESEANYGQRRSVESDYNGARLRRDGQHFRCYCPLCGLEGPRAETTRGAMYGWRAARHQWHTAEQASAAEEQSLPASGPLDQRELRLIQIVYHGKGCAACS
jgi:hypothetical protein